MTEPTETEKNHAACLAAIRNDRPAVLETLLLSCTCGHRWPRKVRIYPDGQFGRSAEEQRAFAQDQICGACAAERSARKHEAMAAVLHAKAVKLRAQQKRAAERRLTKGASRP